MKKTSSLTDPSRRAFFKKTAAAAAVVALPNAVVEAAESRRIDQFAEKMEQIPVAVRVNGSLESREIDPRTTLLDFLRDHLDLTGTKKGCDHGQCGACTVHIDGRRSLACLTLAASCDGRAVTTIEGLAHGDVLHPMQAAFIECDGLQCGFCTPGQIMSAIGLVDEKRATSAASIREFMSGNLCRCGAYPNIVHAIQRAQK